MCCPRSTQSPSSPAQADTELPRIGISGILRRARRRWPPGGTNTWEEARSLGTETSPTRQPFSGMGRAVQHPFSGPTCLGRPGTVRLHRPSSPRPTECPPRASRRKTGRNSVLRFSGPRRLPAEVPPTDQPTRPWLSPILVPASVARRQRL